MTGVPAPAGWVTERPAMIGSIGRWSWDHPDCGHVIIDLYPPRQVGGRGNERMIPPAYSVRTGPSTFGPDFTDPDAARRFGWDFMRAMHAAAEILEHGVPDEAPVEPDPQRTFDDLLQEAHSG